MNQQLFEIVSIIKQTHTLNLKLYYKLQLQYIENTISKWVINSVIDIYNRLKLNFSCKQKLVFIVKKNWQEFIDFI